MTFLIFKRFRILFRKSRKQFKISNQFVILSVLTPTCCVETTLAVALRWFSYLWQMAIRPRLSSLSRMSGSLTMLPLPPLDNEALMMGRNAGISFSRIKSGSSSTAASLLGRLTTISVESFPPNFLGFRCWPESSPPTVSVVLTDLFERRGDENRYFDVLPFFGDSPIGLLTV